VKIKKPLVFICLLAAIIVVVILVQDKYGCAKDNKDACLLKVVQTKENVDQGICDEISTVDGKDQCFFILAQKNGKNGADLCSYININKTEADQNGNNNDNHSQDIISKDYCYYSLALSAREPSICERVSSTDQKILCIKSLNLTKS